MPPALPESANTVPLPRIPFSFAKRYRLILAADPEPALYVDADTPRHALTEVQRLAGRFLAVKALDEAAFDQALQKAYEHGTTDAAEMAENLGDELALDDIAASLSEPSDLMDSDDDAPIIRLINALLTEAVKRNASDVHVEPYEHRLAVRFRIDGVLHPILEPSAAMAGLLVSRIKVMAKLDIAEKRLPQDGRISLRIAGRPVDVRVSTLPSGHGERVVMRLLDKQAGRLELDQLDLAPAVQQPLEQLIQRPHGILLVTGPTGSGKTTTLYAALAKLNDRRRNIMTVEDPIEYYIDGISQTHVNSKVDMTFARGLRAILRQDPDVVMIGEVRDLETAEIAVQASLTGHMVFSTLHTNSAIGAITRLRDMGVEPFLLSSSLIGVMAQRLVRLLCPHCKRPHRPTAAECTHYGFSADEVLYQPHGCTQCNQLGYQGRIGIYELSLIDEAMRIMIHDHAGEHKMESHARSHTPSILQDGLRRVSNGQTALEEVLRICQDH